jgi:signal transduction histidine kinase
MKSEHWRAVIALTVVVAAVLGLTFVLCWVERDWRMVNEPLHSTCEAMGGLVAILMATSMLQRRDDPYGGRMVMVAVGFLAMGILQIAHSIPHPGQPFVFLRSMASLAGGAGFLHVCLPQRLLLRAIAWRRLLIWTVVAGSLFVAVWALVPGAPLPVMVRDDEFTLITYAINITAGLSFLVAAMQLMSDFWQTDRRSLWMLAGMAALFGLADILFRFSSMWDNTWWSWHLVQLVAAGIVFYEVMAEHRLTVARLRDALKERERAQGALRHLNETLERRVSAQTADLKRSNDELAQFAYIASHDLQEPLRSIKGFLDLVIKRQKDRLDEDGKQCIEFARDGAERMRTLIGALLSYSRISTQAKTLAPCDTRAVIERVMGDLSFAIQDCGARVIWGALPVVSGDNQQLGQVFQNLVSNALKFRGAAPPVIRISAKRDGAFWQFSVADNGIGIEPRFAEQIFEVFHRLHSREEYAGSGIGLAICRKIVRRHGGKIWVESSLGRGATFHFTLPAAGQAPAGGEESETVLAAGTEAAG